MEVQVRVHSVGRPAEAQDDDDALGERLVALVRDAMTRGGAPPAAVVVTGERVDVVPLAPVVEAKMSPAAFLAGLTRHPIGGGTAEAVGLIGTFRVHRAPEDPGVPIVMVFLEWTDCRWWQWRALLETGDLRALRPDTETLLRATDGTAKPARLGGWWSLGRRHAIDLAWQKREPVIH
jgi:hypothetical protein